MVWAWTWAMRQPGMFSLVATVAKTACVPETQEASRGMSERAPV